MRDTAKQIENQTKQVSYGLLRAYKEYIRLGSNIVNDFVEEVVGESELSSEAKPKRVRNALSNVVDRYLDLPEKVIDRFYETYKGSTSSE